MGERGPGGWQAEQGPSASASSVNSLHSLMPISSSPNADARCPEDMQDNMQTSQRQGLPHSAPTQAANKVPVLSKLKLAFIVRQRPRKITLYLKKNVVQVNMTKKL